MNLNAKVSLVILGLLLLGAAAYADPAPSAPGSTPGVVPGLAPGVAPANAPASAATAPAAENAAVYRFRQAAKPADCYIGSLDPSRGYAMRVDLTSTGAAITWITLTQYKLSAMGSVPYAVFRNCEPATASQPNVPNVMAARAITIDGQKIALEADKGQFEDWTLEPGADPGHATYSAVIEDGQGHAAVEIRRTYELAKGSYDLACRQQIISKAGRPLTVLWEQNLIADVPPDEAGSRSDVRQFDAGIYDLDYDAPRRFMYTKNTTVARTAALDAFAKDRRPYWPVAKLPSKYELEWIAATNRYFALVVHRPIPAPAPGQTGHVLVPALVGDDRQVGLAVIGAKTHDADQRAAAITFSTPALSLAPGAAQELDLCLFAGPRDGSLFAREPYRNLCLDKLPKYNVGCSWCILDWLADGLLWVLKALKFVTFDWGVAIVILVLVIRLLLHPITRRSQIAMMRTQKQMAALKPELETLKARCKDDSTRYQQEQAKLFKEKGISPFSMAGGCLPMLLQTPIWASLYAMLYSAIELRNQPAFYGVFQKISGRHWGFLADLSSPDNFLMLPESLRFHLPLIGLIEGLNILPLLMALVFYVQQKIMTPPAADDQARQQQKIAAWTTLLFPVMMYSYPSGLTLYIMASTAAGIVDSTIVRRHIQREEEAGTLFKKVKPGKAGGLWDRLQRMAEDRRRALEGGDRRRRFKERD